MGRGGGKGEEGKRRPGLETLAAKTTCRDNHIKTFDYVQVQFVKITPYQRWCEIL